MLNAVQLETAMETASSGPSSGKAPDVVTLVVAGWIGKKRYCEARVVERGPEFLTVIAAAPLEAGEQIWFMENEAAGGMFVRTATQTGAGYRLELHREKRRSPRWRVDEEGQIEWRSGKKAGRANVVVLDVSAGGLRFRTVETIPDSCEVRVKFAGMVRDGELRYALALGGATIAGMEFI